MRVCMRFVVYPGVSFVDLLSGACCAQTTCTVRLSFDGTFLIAARVL